MLSVLAFCSQGTAFEGGRYHGRILFPSEYPFKPPSIALLTPNGRFDVGKKICLSVSAHHPESWQPAWGIRTIITALTAFFPSKAEGALAGLDYTDKERRTLAERSATWRCATCGVCMAEVALDNFQNSQPQPSATTAAWRNNRAVVERTQHSYSLQFIIIILVLLAALISRRLSASAVNRPTDNFAISKPS